MAYSGNYVRTATVVSKRDTRTNWGTGVDPDHAQGRWGSDQGTPTPTTPPGNPVPDAVIDRYNPVGVNANPSLAPFEHEPKGHEGTGQPPRSHNRYDEIASDTTRHDENFGAMLRRTVEVTMRSISQVFGNPRVESLPPYPNDGTATATGEAARALRGRNSLALNNPGNPEINFSGDYIRQGMEIVRINDRSMPRQPLTHDFRPIYLNVASTANVTQGPNGENYSPYSSPYASVADVSMGTSRPMARREPRMWDETVVTDGTEGGYRTSEFSSWGL